MTDPDPWRLLAHDGARRAVVRQLTRELLVDYSGASWGEWVTLGLVAEACAEMPQPLRRPVKRARRQPT